MDVIHGMRFITDSIQHGSNSSRLSQVMLIAGDRRRTETLGSSSKVYEIECRDLKKTYRVFEEKKRYQEIPIYDLLTEEDRTADSKSARHWKAWYLSQQAPSSSNLARIVVEHRKTSEQSFLLGCPAFKWLSHSREEHHHQGMSIVTETSSEAWYLDSICAKELYPVHWLEQTSPEITSVTMNPPFPGVEQTGPLPTGICALSESTTLVRSELSTGKVEEIEFSNSYSIVSAANEIFATTIFQPPVGFSKVPTHPGWLAVARMDFFGSIQRFFRRPICL